MQFFTILFILSASSLLALAVASPAMNDLEMVKVLVQSIVENDVKEEALDQAAASEVNLQQIPVSEAMFQQNPVSQEMFQDSEAMEQENAVEQANSLNNGQKIDFILRILKPTYYKSNEGVGHDKAIPAFSCAELLKYWPSTPSGKYWIYSNNGQSSLQYCDMTKTCGGITGGWMQVAAFDMTDHKQNCPKTLLQRSDHGKRSCAINRKGCGCSGVFFPVKSAGGYSKVCGKIIGYQIGSMDTFLNIGRGANPSIDKYYVDGVSVTRGSPREHIWTLAAGLFEGKHSRANCRCTYPSKASLTTPPPSYVGNDYFCDTGAHKNFVFGKIYTGDPLWDGAGCGKTNKCCDFNNPPWFYKNMKRCSTDRIEVRLCRDQGQRDEDVSVESIELYVQ